MALGDRVTVLTDMGGNRAPERTELEARSAGGTVDVEWALGDRVVVKELTKGGQVRRSLTVARDRLVSVMVEPRR